MTDQPILNDSEPMPGREWDRKTITSAESEAVMKKFLDPIPFTSEEEIDCLGEDRAMEVIRATRRMLLGQLLYQEYHEHFFDDCGDDLIAATENWAALHGTLFTNDYQNVVEEVQKFLRMQGYPLGGCDGEIRYALLSEELFETLGVRAGELSP